ncbi:DUF4097 family beta strand repeat-containing protein [Salisediminibacterium selenitireducens]|uniref:Uncharacterized protein n=1 Tax=Bacillus selenitireducens (strain ATCC 700615 / DSM 15326 / MLS10) TaxID=439292 RepID=D6Y101_BACIE|nr:DUF4097 domain-containing protein [Salisediminibacterium selenitireducens]ADH98605.1 conserved hypothetical protein [[Bacillus] selenitireducens MLS10]
MQEEQKMILKMIEDGKVTAEEGLELLKELRERPEQKDAAQEEEQERPSAESHFPSRDVKWEERREFYGTEEKVRSFAAKFSDFVDDAFHKIKEFDLDFNFGSAVEVEHIFQHHVSAIEKVDVHVENGSITFIPTDEDQVRVENHVKVYRVKDAEEARKAFLDEVDFRVRDGLLKYHVNRKTMKVNTVIYVPKQELMKVQLYTFNGSIESKALSCRKVEIKTINGKIRLSALEGEYAKLETANGTVTVDQLNVDQTDVKTINGTITVAAGGGDFDAETVNGTIQLYVNEAKRGRAYLKTSAGSIQARLHDSLRIEGELRTNVGSIRNELPECNVLEEKKEFGSRKMTFIANKHVEPNYYIEAESHTGSVITRV